MALTLAIRKKIIPLWSDVSRKSTKNILLKNKKSEFDAKCFEQNRAKQLNEKRWLKESQTFLKNIEKTWSES